MTKIKSVKEHEKQYFHIDKQMFFKIIYSNIIALLYFWFVVSGWKCYEFFYNEPSLHIMIRTGFLGFLILFTVFGLLYVMYFITKNL